MNGTFTLLAIRGTPLYLQDLFTGTTVEDLQFQRNLHSFNCALAFTSMGGNIDQRLKDQGEILPIAILGQLSYHTGPLRITDGAHGRYSQLYIINTRRVINERMRNN
jgi:hypothetical protein